MSARLQNCPVILTFARHYLPGYKGGGPIRSIANMVEWLGDSYDFRIVTSDRDYTEPHPYPDVEIGKWNEVGKAKVLYLPPDGRGWNRIRRLLREEPHDLLYLNSLFDTDFTLKPLLMRQLSSAPRKPVILAPRGELSAGSRGQKAWKKAPFLTIARKTGLYRDLIWHASTIHDRTDISRIMRVAKQAIRIAPNLPATAVCESSTPFCTRGSDEPLRVCYISRISPEKNLDFALNVLRWVRSLVRFDIYGPIRDEGTYWAKCQKLMGELPPNVTATYRGSVPPSNVGTVLAAHDLFFLPTRGENFGHIIMESLSAGTPVLIADTTPWRDLAARGAGWDLALAFPEDFAQKIDEMAAVSPDGQGRMRDRVLAFAKSRREESDAVEATRRLFLHAMDTTGNDGLS